MEIGSYSPDDVMLLLTDISDKITEVDTEEREKLIQSGIHYSEMLPKEYEPSQRYHDLFISYLECKAYDIADLVSSTADKIEAYFKGKTPVLISLARAGTPIGILLRRYIYFKYNKLWPHYSISIIRGKGIDYNALRYICKMHDPSDFIFIDGWTGKGAITKELQEACASFKEYKIKPRLAVLSDPGHCANISGTFEDVLIPNACLNATVSGLISRTFHRDDIIGPDQFHGVKYYHDKKDQDLSHLFLDTICKYFVKNIFVHYINFYIDNPTFEGMEAIKRIQDKFKINSIHRIKPGLGETTRVLLRRVPWKIIYRSEAIISLVNVFSLAFERNIPLEVYNDMPYACCGLIKEVDKT